MASRSRAIVERTQTRAFVLRRTPVGEADVLVMLFTEACGVLSVAARSARRPQSKLGALEPIHTLLVTIELRPGAEIGKLADARIDKARLRATTESDRLDASFRALTWVRGVTSPLQPEPRIFDVLTKLLDVLDADGEVPARTALASAGLHILDALGYGLAFDACVSCGAVCPWASSATIDPARGGLICRACGGARILVRGSLRRALESMRQLPLDLGAANLDADEEHVALEIVESAFLAHAAPLGKTSKRR